MPHHRYEVRVAGRLSDRACGAFPDMVIDTAPVETVISGDDLDEAGLYGLLELCRTMGLEVISFSRATS